MLNDKTHIEQRVCNGRTVSRTLQGHYIGSSLVIVVGADTDVGRDIVTALLAEAAELRVFVTDPDAGHEPR